MRRKKEEEEAMWAEYIEQRKKQRSKEEEELKKLKERQVCVRIISLKIDDRYINLFSFCLNRLD